MIGVTYGGNEVQWLTENSERLSMFGGEWLLIQGSALVAHSKDFAQIRHAIKEHRIGVPFVYYVPRPEGVECIP